MLFPRLTEDKVLRLPRHSHPSLTCPTQATALRGNARSAATDIDYARAVPFTQDRRGRRVMHFKLELFYWKARSFNSLVPG
jgi:hypothetical protein